MKRLMKTKFAIVFAIIATMLIATMTTSLVNYNKVEAASKKTINIIVGGKQGPPGEPGAPGPQGEQGVQGIQGEQGPPGEVGPAGADGAAGAAGEQGPQGVQGEQGAQGERGEKGDTGSVTLNICQPAPAGCQPLEAENGDNITIIITPGNETSGQPEEPEVPPVGNETEPTPPQGNETTGGEQPTHPIQCAEGEFYNMATNQCEASALPPEQGGNETGGGDQGNVTIPVEGNITLPEAPTNETPTGEINVTVPEVPSEGEGDQGGFQPQ